MEKNPNIGRKKNACYDIFLSRSMHRTGSLMTVIKEILK
jgi:hypothetical protein